MLKSKINISNKTIDIITNDIPSSLSISQCIAGRLLKNLTIRFNIYLYTSTAPSIYTKGITTLIPKCKHPTIPSQFRPITSILHLYYVDSSTKLLLAGWSAI